MISETIGDGAKPASPGLRPGAPLRGLEAPEATRGGAENLPELRVLELALAAALLAEALTPALALTPPLANGPRRVSEFAPMLANVRANSAAKALANTSAGVSLLPGAGQLDLLFGCLRGGGPDGKPGIVFAFRPGKASEEVAFQLIEE